MKKLFKVPLLLLFTVTSTYGQPAPPTKSTRMPTCLSVQEIQTFKSAFLRHITSRNYLAEIASTELKTNGDLSVFNDKYNIHVAQRSSETLFTFIENGKDKNPITSNFTPKASSCVIAFGLRLPENVRKQCDDNGAYGFFFGFEKQQGTIRLISIGDAVDSPCDAVK